ncbi:MAG TPA: hypothetical protein VN231_10100 [Allosphingosinicella sp.]|nr:hypothetical protein [Allosphingosinicella sp.]
MKIAIAALAALCAAALSAPEALAKDRTVRCVIVSHGSDTYRGPCHFLPEEGGTFTVTPLPDREFPSGHTGIQVNIVEPGVAEVYGLTPAGPASRWGTAVRSRRDRACWEGPDFSICAY